MTPITGYCAITCAGFARRETSMTAIFESWVAHARLCRALGPAPARQLCQFYIANGIVLVPTFHHANDARALRILQKEFPDRRVIGLEAREWIRGFGSLHRLTQQEPE